MNTKSFAFFAVCMAASLPGFCASTCETRVDSHQNATTLERVRYCLTPEEELPAPAGSELVYYGVSSKAPAEEPASDGRYKQRYFDKNGVAVSQDYLGTRRFPAFTNDTLSEQERIALEAAEKEAWEKAQQEAAKKAATEKAPARLSAPSVLAEQEPVMSKAQLAARKEKPKRFMKEPVQEAAPEVAPAAFPTGTPETELQAVQELQNDPLTQPYANAGGAAPEGFLDDNLLTDDSSFGYNATDPAMQP